MFVGLTGQIGAGKTTAAEILASFGAAVIDADRIGRKVVDESLTLRRLLARAFGGDVLNDHGRLDRHKLAERAFADDESRQVLNSLVHPLLLKELGKRMKLLARRRSIVVIDAALLLEWELDRQMAMVIVITADEKLRFERLRARGISLEDAMARQQLQLPLAEFQSRAGHIINNGSINLLRAQLRKLWDDLIAPEPTTLEDSP